MKRTQSCLFAIVAVLSFASSQAIADFTFSTEAGGNVTTATDLVIAFNDVANGGNGSGPVTGGPFTDFSITLDWATGFGFPPAFSNSATVDLITASGNTFLGTATSGGAATNTATSLTFDGVMPGYDQGVDGSLSVAFGQTAGTSTSTFTNISLTLIDGIVTPPSTVATINMNGAGQFATYNDPALAAGDVVWFEVNWDGASPLTMDTIGSGNDTEIGVFDAAGNLLGSDDDDGSGFPPGESLITSDELGLTAGTYYVASGGWNMAFADGFDATSDGSGTPANFNIDVNFSTAAIPEPSSFALMGLALVGFVAFRRRRKA